MVNYALSYRHPIKLDEYMPLDKRIAVMSASESHSSI